MTYRLYVAGHFSLMLCKFFICSAGEKAEKEKDAEDDDVEINTDAR